MVQPAWWDEVGESVDHADLPFGVVDHSVVAAAQEQQIVEVGGAAVFPVSRVMSIGPSGCEMAAWKRAAFVPGGEGAALVGFDQAVLATQVQWH